jgi:type I restriction enzyme S subunit
MAGEWREIALWDIAEYINGRATKPSELASNGVPVIKIAELNRGITEETDRIPPELVQEKHWVSHGDLLFAWSGSVGIYRYTGSKAALNQHIFRVVGKPGIDQGFLRYLLLSCMPVFHLHVQDKRTTMGHVTKQDLQRIKVRVPPLQEQRAIAPILGTLDDKIELNRRMSQTLEAMARALFKAWFVDFEPVRAKMEGRWQRGQSLPGLPAHLYDLFPDRLVDSELGEIPEGWRVGTLPDLFDFLEGPGLRNWQYRDEGIKFLNIRCISDGDVDIAKANCISREEFKEKYSHFALQEDDVVISTSGTLGRLAVVRDDHLPIMLNTSIIRFRGLGAVGLTYVWGFLQSVYFLGEMQALASGSVQLNFGPMHLRQISVIQPSEKVLYEFECAAQPLLRKSLTLRKQSRTLAALRDALLPKLISGELRVKDAERFLKERGI